jgi:hypothetical protein
VGRFPRLVLAALAVAVGVQVCASADVNLGLVDVLGRSMPSLRDGLEHPSRPAAGVVLLARADRLLPDAPVMLVDVSGDRGTSYATAFAYELYPRRRLYGPPAVWPSSIVAYARARGARYLLVRRRRTAAPWRLPPGLTRLRSTPCCVLAEVAAR